MKAEGRAKGKRRRMQTDPERFSSKSRPLSQGHVQGNFRSLQGWRSHKLPGQPIALLDPQMALGRRLCGVREEKTQLKGSAVGKGKGGMEKR